MDYFTVASTAFFECKGQRRGLLGTEGCSSPALGRGFNSMAFQNVGDGAGPHGVAEIGQCARQPIVAPRRILTGNPHDQLRDRLRDARPPGALSIVGPLAGSEIPIPVKQRFGCHHVGHFFEDITPESLRFCRQAPRPSFDRRNRRPRTCRLKTRFSSIIYSVTACRCRFTQPASATASKCSTLVLSMGAQREQPNRHR